MAKISAWLAAAAAAAIVLATAPWRSFEFASIGPIAAALLLGLAAWRTLAGRNGGLRLLSGAWGLAAGLAWYAPSYNFPDFVPLAAAITAPVLVSVIGLALVVLHKERKT